MSFIFRCTCPGLFLASMTDTIRCSCACDWPDASRRRDCQSLAKGKEHFGLRDRVCVQVGNCTPPSCEYGVYDSALGRCPLRKYRRARYHRGGRSHEKTYSVWWTGNQEYLCIQAVKGFEWESYLRECDLF